ncbi:MAG: hypothetical protein VR73_06965 [Gammaproteobacteria bacterium BRH_c0]|nr:MAG: hypothetical protein VR73_06965 [Gammaproteobacteria bacterium BRH_c0]
MTESLKNRILNIKHEVKELHPLLQVIFTKIPTITSVSYTHGNSEMGADFILTKVAEEIGDTEYIGVVAKLGKITQDLSSINQQIEECTVKRISPSGKKEIYLSEVWIVANGSISTNAKDKIYERYKSQKVKFLDINRLYDLTVKYVPDYGVEVDLADMQVLEHVRISCVERERKHSLIQEGVLREFMQPEIEKVEDDFSGRKIYIDIFDQISKSNFVSIESQMGGGKTTLLNQICKHYSDLEIYKEEKLLPIYIPCSEMVHEDYSLSTLIDKYISQYKLPISKDRKFLILIDGVDESKDENDETTNKIHCLIEELSVKEDVKLMIASREITSDLLGANDKFRKNRYEIKPLNLKSMIRFLEKLCSGLDLKNRLLEDLKDSELFKILPKTPIAAIILAKLISEGVEELPMNLTELYAKYCEISLGRWDIQKGLMTQKEYEALDAISCKIAEYMLENELPSLSPEEAKSFFRDYLSERNLHLHSDELFDNMLKRSGIFIESNKNGAFSFKHRSFAEFFYAKNLLSRQKVNIDSSIFHPYWTSAYFFYVGLRRDCPELLEEIISLPINHEGHRFSKLINMGNFLLAAYQTPYAVIESGIYNVISDAGQYYSEVADEKNKSFLGVFPPIHLFAIFNSIILRHYNFKFFERAVVSALEEISTDPNKTNSSAYSLFFLDSLRFSLGHPSLFDSLLELCGDNLPLVVQLSINHESKRRDYQSPAIKKVVKRLTKQRKTSLQFESSVTRLYEATSDGTKIVKSSGRRQPSSKKTTGSSTKKK